MPPEQVAAFGRAWLFSSAEYLTLSVVVFAPDMGPIRAHLEEGMRKLQGCYYQVVLRELETVNGRPERLRHWAEAGIDLAAKYA